MSIKFAVLASVFNLVTMAHAAAVVSTAVDSDTKIAVAGDWTPLQDGMTQYVVKGHTCGSVVAVVTPVAAHSSSKHYWYGFTYQISGAHTGLRIHNDSLDVIKAQVVADCSVQE